VIRYELCKAIHAIYIDRAATEAVRSGDFSILDRFALDPEERAALEAKDLVTLYRLGAHPVLIFHLSAVLNPRETYIREVVPNLAGLPNPFYDYYRQRKSGAESPSKPPAEA
jgi:hypothetical protein